MIYTAKVNYNELGKKLTDKDFTFVRIESEYKITEAQLANHVKLYVPEQMIETIEDVSGGFSTVKPGDLIHLFMPETSRDGCSRILYNKFVKVVEVNDRGIKIEDHRGYFDFTGNEINPRKKKDIHYIELPTEDALKNYEKNKRYDELIEELENLIDVCDHYNLTNEQLERIIDIFNEQEDDFGFK